MRDDIPYIFVVSLTNATDRREHIAKIMRELGFEYELVDAVDGNKLSTAELERVYREDVSKNYIGRGLTVGEIGCYMSHIKVAEMIVERGLSEALIMEDDIAVKPELKSFLQNRDKLPEDWELVHLCSSVPYPNSCIIAWYRKFWSICPGYEVGIPHGVLWGTQGYLVRLSMAEKMIQCAYPILGPIDGRLFDINYSISNFYVLREEKLVTHMQLETDQIHFQSIIDTNKERLAEQNSTYSKKQKKRNLLMKILFHCFNFPQRVVFRIYFLVLVRYFKPKRYCGWPDINFVDSRYSRLNKVKFLYNLYLPKKKGSREKLATLNDRTKP